MHKFNKINYLTILSFLIFLCPFLFLALTLILLFVMVLREWITKQKRMLKISGTKKDTAGRTTTPSRFQSPHSTLMPVTL